MPITKSENIGNFTNKPTIEQLTTLTIMNQKVDDVEMAPNSNLGENNTDYEAPKSQNGESNQNKELRPGTGRLIYQQNESGKAETNTITGETATQTFDTKRTRKPNYKGAINLDGKKLILSAWINVSKKGKGRFLGSSAKVRGSAVPCYPNIIQHR